MGAILFPRSVRIAEFNFFSAHLTASRFGVAHEC
jgi:hypothetical protein